MNIKDQIHHGRVSKDGKGLVDYDKRINPDEPMMVVKFINVQDPGHSVAFDLGVPVVKDVVVTDSKNKPIIDDSTGEVKTRKIKVNEFEHYHLRDQRVYRLPERVVKHLNSLQYPVYENQVDEETKQMVSRQIGWTNRFAITPVDLLPDQTAKGPAQGPRGRSSFPQTKTQKEASS